MPGVEPRHLHIYCICGQKMNVSEDMFGRPARCVSCGQKLRIPVSDELPDDEDEVHLQDHPEFLRGVGAEDSSKRAEPSGEDGKGSKAGKVPAQDEQEAELGSPVMVAIDMLEPLRALVSLEYRINHKIAVLKKYPERERKSSYTKSQLRQYRKSVRAAREELYEELRQRLMETAIELTSTQEKISEAVMAARVGEAEFTGYHEQVERLRLRRDCLERRQVNLRGWLAVRSPYEAGGYVRLPIDQLPATDDRIPRHHEPPEDANRLEWWIQSLREAMVQKEQAERRLAQADRMEGQGRALSVDMEHRRVEAQSTRDRAQAQIAFSKERLEQATEDYQEDLEAVDAQLDNLRTQLSSGKLNHAKFSAREKPLLEAKARLNSGLDMLERAHGAVSAQDVPRPRGSYLARLSAPSVEGAPGLSFDAWLAFGAAGLMILTVFLPYVGNLSALGVLRELGPIAPYTHWLLTIPVLMALLIVASAFIPYTPVRGTAYIALWLCLAIGASFFLHEASWSVGPIGQRFQQGGWWFVRAGVVVFVVSHLLLLAAAAIPLLQWAPGRIILGATVGCSVLLAAVIFSNLGGLLVADPQLDIEQYPPVAKQPDITTVDVSVENGGLRAMLLTAKPETRCAYDFLVEQRIGQDSWADVGAPKSLEASGAQIPVGVGLLPDLTLKPGTAATFRYELPPGQYRVFLREGVDKQFAVASMQPMMPATSSGPEPAIEESETELPAAPEEEAEEPLADDPDAAMESEPEIAVPQPVGPLLPQVELRGMLLASGRMPQFRLDVTLPDGRVNSLMLSLDDTVYRAWYVAEYNPEEETVTLSNGQRFLILRRGNRVDMTD